MVNSCIKERGDNLELLGRLYSLGPSGLCNKPQFSKVFDVCKFTLKCKQVNNLYFFTKRLFFRQDHVESFCRNQTIGGLNDKNCP